MPGGDSAQGPSENQIALVPFPFNPPVAAGITWVAASTQGLSIPRVLVNYYDQQVTAQLSGELRNAEVALTLLTTSNEPLENRLFCQISGAPGQVLRRSSGLQDLSEFFQLGQMQCLGLRYRLVQTALPVVVRNLAVVLYFGSITIGRQEER